MIAALDDCLFREDEATQQRAAVLHHEFTHIEVGEPDKHGRLPLSLRKHDVEEFAQTMRAFGPIIPGRRQLIAAYKGWAEETGMVALPDDTTA